MDNFEFGDVKSVRKSLLIVATIGIFVSKLTHYSTGEISFLGFSIPVKDASFLPYFIGYIILFYLVALIIRYSDEEFKKFYVKKLNSLKGVYTVTYLDPKEEQKRQYAKKLKGVRKSFKYAIISLEILFPIVLGISALIYIYCN